MNPLTIWFIVIAIIAIMGGVIYALIRDCKKQKQEIKELKNELNSARENVKQLSLFIKIAEKIKEAKTDEEVHNIINDIIALNNSRVQND